MRQSSRTAVAAAVLSATVSAASLADICTVSNVQAALPTTLLGIEFDSSAVTASTVNSTTANYCSVTVTYTHPGKNDTVLVKYAFPDPTVFKNRYYVAGGGGFTLNQDITGGLTYGAVAGATSAGYDAFNYGYDDQVLYGNGSINWDATYMFGYQALGEMTQIAKPLTRGVYGLASDTKIYTYYEGCSDGGREGMSQVQRYGAEYDGAITGAPALRFGQMQASSFSLVLSQNLDTVKPGYKETGHKESLFIRNAGAGPHTKYGIPGY